MTSPVTSSSSDNFFNVKSVDTASSSKKTTADRSPMSLPKLPSILRSPEPPPSPDPFTHRPPEIPRGAPRDNRRNIGIFRIDHEGKIFLKPPFRIHSNKKAGIKPRLVPSIVFKEVGVRGQIEEPIKHELAKKVLTLPKRECLQLNLFED